MRWVAVATAGGGVVVGAALALGALSLMEGNAAVAPDGSSRAVPAYVGPASGRPTDAVPALATNPSALALERAFLNGPARGTWEIVEPHGTRTRSFADDPENPERVWCRMGDGENAPVLSFAREHAGKRVFSELPLGLFFEAYRPEGGATRAEDEGRGLERTRWASRAGPPSPTRDVWVDPGTGDVVRIEDLAWNGVVLHAARLVSTTLGDWAPRAGEKSRRSKGFGFPGWPFPTPKTLEEVARIAPLPVFEPMVLPAGFRRVDASYRRWPMRPWADVVTLKYSDGLAKIELLIARPDDLDRIEAFAKAMAAKGMMDGPDEKGQEPSPCETSPAGTPEELLDEADLLLVRRREDKCRTVLRVDGLLGVSVELTGRNELQREAYVATIRSLVRAAGSREHALEPSDR